eukprot:gnl/MRDRNA2_/MRDRNA2_16759_c0_seq1.p1 gnl/MRDRNA2_/MRDRNA2_16759_c0~~gnl/MRDRNA2_/MRDRNA2_16759_c0_seq1.p1  ORF type:complete len:203 (+),score=37.06 gnl/MRDRNA2_/MRDRNA2_16759_c0_seq1:123-731(+)
MQSVIRSTEVRLGEQKVQRQNARVRSCRVYIAMLVGMMLLGIFITTNILLLRQYILYEDRAGIEDTGEDPVGPLLHQLQDLDAVNESVDLAKGNTAQEQDSSNVFETVSPHFSLPNRSRVATNTNTTAHAIPSEVEAVAAVPEEVAELAHAEDIIEHRRATRQNMSANSISQNATNPRGSTSASDDVKPQVQPKGSLRGASR